MIEVVTTQVRQSVDTPFFLEVDVKTREEFALFCSSTGLMAEAPVFSSSEDKLTHTSVARFQNLQKFNEFHQLLETTIPGFLSRRDSYSLQHGITVSRTITVI